MPEELWLGETGAMVCVRPSCAGQSLSARIMIGRGLEKVIEIDGAKFSRMSKADLAELGPLIASSGGVLECDGGHVRYNFTARQLETVGVSA